jgi:hypothetical protein
VRATMLLLLDKGRGFGVFCRFCARDDRGSFLIVETGRAAENILLGVAAGVMTFALTLLLPGAVMDSLPDVIPNLLGVAGAWKVPSLVVGLLLLLDMAEAGRNGGGILLSAPKKLDLRLPLACAGDDGSEARLSMVRSESDGRDFFLRACSGSGSFRATCCGSGSGSGSVSRNPALDPALEDALDADLKPSRLPNASSSFVFDLTGGGGFEAWRDGGRAKGRLKTGSAEDAAAFGPKLRMPLTRLVEEAKDARLGPEATGAAVGGAFGRMRDALDVFFWRLGCGLGRGNDGTDGFLRSGSVGAGWRS